VHTMGFNRAQMLTASPEVHKAISQKVRGSLATPIVSFGPSAEIWTPSSVFRQGDPDSRPETRTEIADPAGTRRGCTTLLFMFVPNLHYLLFQEKETTPPHRKVSNILVSMADLCFVYTSSPSLNLYYS